MKIVQPRVGLDVAVNEQGEAFVTGYTESSDFPTTPDGLDYGGDIDAFLVQLSAAGDALLYGTYLGGAGEDYGAAIALDDWDGVYVTGFTYSADFPMIDPYDGSFGGYDDVFVSKLSAS